MNIMIDAAAGMTVILIYLLVLFFVSNYDYIHMQVKLNEALVLVGLGVFYLLFVTGLYIDTLSTLLLLLMLFGIPCLFGFGLGDLLVFISMAPFLAVGDIKVYLIFFFITWVVWHIMMVRKNVREGVLRGYGESFSKSKAFTLQYPLIPVILVSFVVWLMYTAC